MDRQFRHQSIGAWFPRAGHLQVVEADDLEVEEACNLSGRSGFEQAGNFTNLFVDGFIASKWMRGAIDDADLLVESSGFGA